MQQGPVFWKTANFFKGMGRPMAFQMPFPGETGGLEYCWTCPLGNFIFIKNRACHFTL